MRLFVIATTYQLFNAINITENEKKYDITCLLLVQTGDRLTQSINISYLNTMFKKIWVCNIKVFDNKLQKLVYFIMELMKNAVYGVKIPVDFDEIFISGTEMYSKIAAYKLKTKLTKLYYYEDGIASYYSVLEEKTKKKKDLLLKIRYGKRSLDECMGLYVYEPKYVCNNTNNIKLYSIPKITERNFEYIDLKKVCYDAPLQLKKRFVFFSTWFENPGSYKLQEKLINVLIDCVGKNNCCIKEHPNEVKSKEPANEALFINSKCNFEISNYFYDYSENIFISVISTACISPSLIYGQEPRVIYLYKIFQKEFELWKDIEETMANISKVYKNKNRIFIPEDMNEYIQILYKLTGA